MVLLEIWIWVLFVICSLFFGICGLPPLDLIYPRGLSALGDLH